jgi:hypothetical protein
MNISYKDLRGMGALSGVFVITVKNAAGDVATGTEVQVADYIASRGDKESDWTMVSGSGKTVDSHPAIVTGRTFASQVKEGFANVDWANIFKPPASSAPSTGVTQDDILARKAAEQKKMVNLGVIGVMVAGVVGGLFFFMRPAKKSGRRRRR